MLSFASVLFSLTFPFFPQLVQLLLCYSVYSLFRTLFDVQDNSGTRVDSRSLLRTGLRIWDFALTPNGRYLVAIGRPTILPPVRRSPPSSTAMPVEGFDIPIGDDPHSDPSDPKRTQMIIFDLLNGSVRRCILILAVLSSI